MARVSSEDESGFTLIELLVTVAVVSILAGTMMSVWSLYRAKAHNAAAQTDLRNGLIALQTYVDDNNAYPTCETATCRSTLQGFSHTDGVYIAFAQLSGTSGTGIACHTSRGDVAYMKSSVVDFIVEIPVGSCGP